MRFYELLFEYDRSKAMAAFGGKLQARIASDPKVESIEELFTQLEQADPTQNKQYVNWLVRAYQAGSKLEDLKSRGFDSLVKFELLKKHKQLPADKTDIGKYENLQHLEDELAKYEVKKPESIQVDRGKYQVLADTPNIRIIIPEDETAAKFWGQGTRWCTAANKNNMFARYNKQGKLYIIIPKHPKYPGEKYQFHFKTNQFMDEKDRRISLLEFINEYPETKKYFADKHIAFNDTLTEKEQLAVVKKVGLAIQFIKNPSEKVQLAAVKQNGLVIRILETPSEDVQLAAVSQIGYAIRDIKNPSEKMQLAAVKRDGNAIQFIKTPSEEVQLAAVRQNGYAIRDIKNPSEAVQLAAVNQDEYAIYDIKNPTPKVIALARSKGVKI